MQVVRAVHWIHGALGKGTLRMHLSSRVPTVNALPALPSMHVSSDRERVVGTTTMKSLVVVVENA